MTLPVERVNPSGQRLHFWNLERRELEQSIDLGANGLVPLEIRIPMVNPSARCRWVAAPVSDEGA